MIIFIITANKVLDHSFANLAISFSERSLFILLSINEPNYLHDLPTIASSLF